MPEGLPPAPLPSSFVTPRSRTTRNGIATSSSLVLLLGHLLASSSIVASSSASSSSFSSRCSTPATMSTPEHDGTLHGTGTLDSTGARTLSPPVENAAIDEVNNESGAGNSSLVPVTDDGIDVERSSTGPSSGAALPRGGSTGRPRRGPDVADNAPDDDDPWSRVGGGRVNERPRRRRASAAGAADAATDEDVATAKHRPSASHEIEASEDEPRYDPVRYKSHLWHSLEGLDRYPNYLSRWNDESDMIRLEMALRVQLDKVQNQRRIVQSYKKFVRSVVAHDEELRASVLSSSVLSVPQSWQELRDRRILDPKLGDAILASQTFRTRAPEPPPSLEAMCAGGGDGIDLDVSRLAPLMDEEVPDVFALDILTPEFGGQLCDWVEAVSDRVQHHLASRTWSFRHDGASASSMISDSDWDSWLAQSRRPLDLRDVGLDWLVNLLFNVVVQPISRHLFLEEMGGGLGRSLDWKQAFVAGYSPAPAASRNTAAPRQHLVPHTDDSEVTLNVCLGRDFAGGVLSFEGLRGQSSPLDPANAQYEYQPQPGRGVIHSGRHFHSVSPVTSGSRYALILWARSWKEIRATTCPCCWLNRRTATGRGAAQPCIAGPQWN